MQKITKYTQTYFDTSEYSHKYLVCFQEYVLFKKKYYYEN